MQVQNTNDSSIVSKLSSCNIGYFEDEWLKMFVGKTQRRSPIINRGYYIRFKAIEAAFQSWFSIVSSRMNEKAQIVSLGAGFDSSYFRLKSLNQLPLGCRYIEIDYPEVIRRKLESIRNSGLKNFLKDWNLSEVLKNPRIVATNEEYTMLGLDLKNYEELESSFKALQIDLSIPTLFLSECAVTYMDVKSSNGLIKWIQGHFPNSAFVTYEQVYPHDGFGIVMQNHFRSLCCPLKSLPSYPDQECQTSRYKEMGWPCCSAILMFDFFMAFTEEEKCRIQTLELFDEYEMWHEKCHHYVLIWASQGIIPIPEMFNIKSSVDIYRDYIKLKVDWKLEDIPISLQRFGHQVALLSSRFLLLSGGFGQLDKRHQRLGGLVCYDLVSERCHQVVVIDPQDFLSKRMFHSMTKLSNSKLVVLGGRSSPKNIFNSVITINCNNIHCLDKLTGTQQSSPLSSQPEETSVSFSVEQKTVMPQPTWRHSASVVEVNVEQKTVMPQPTWRHSASVVEVNGIENIVIFGGCSSFNNATNECFILNTQTWTWSKVPHQEHTPSPRHSHSSVSYNQSKVAITCGLSKSESILNSVYIFDTQQSKWSTLVIPGLIPRYSHTSYFRNNNIFLVGGKTSVPGFTPSIGLINLETLVAVEFSSPAQDPEYPILLSNHCSYLDEDKIIITGGGGNCFSFGTHFNRKSVVINFKNLLPL